MNILKFLVSVTLLIYCFSYDLKAKNLEIEITKNLRCLICQGQSVYDSDSEFANSLKILVEKKLNEGLDEKQIYDYLKINMESGFCMIQDSVKIPIFFGYYLY